MRWTRNRIGRQAGTADVMNVGPGGTATNIHKSSKGDTIPHMIAQPPRSGLIPLPIKIPARYNLDAMKTSRLSLVLLLSITAVLAALPSADELIAEAKAKVTAENKSIYVHFGASWCGWCRRLDAFLERPDIKPVFEKYFVPVKLVVQENAESIRDAS